MDILVSFNNTYQSPGYPVLGVLDPDALTMRIVDLPDNIPQTGILGLAVSSKYLFLGIQHDFDATRSVRKPPEIGLEYSEDGVLASKNRGALLVLDRDKFTVVEHYPFEMVKDVHSFLLSPDDKVLYVVSTGTDEVIRLGLDDGKVVRESVHWKPGTATERVDNHHLNSIIEWQGDMLVSGFGQKENPDDWNTARNGFIYNLTREEFIVEGLQQPHSLAIIRDRLAFCESRNKCVRFVDEYNTPDETIYPVEGYSRGLCEVYGSIFIGTSSRRVRSKSTGKLVKNVEGTDAGCTLTRIASNEVSTTVSLADVAQEIYEMIPIDTTAAWRFKPSFSYKTQLRLGWTNQVNLAITEISDHVDHTMPLIMVDEMVLAVENVEIPGISMQRFGEREGVFWGAPQDDESALLSLQAIEQEHKRFTMAFLWPSFWQLEAFPEMKTHLERNYEQVFASDRVNIFSKK